jgi:hypothetical protein
MTRGGLSNPKPKRSGRDFGLLYWPEGCHVAKLKAGLKLFSRYFFDQINDAVPQFSILDGRESLDQGHAIVAGYESADVRGGRRRKPGSAGSALKEIRFWHSQNMRNVSQSGSTNAISSLLIFLDLLVGDAERGGQRFQGHSKHLAAQAGARTHMRVGRVG